MLYIGVMPKAQTIAIVLALFVSVLMSAQQATSPQQTTNPQQATLPQPAPSLKLHDLKGAAHTLEDYRGKPVLLNFWATWCVPCAAEMPL
ncbi:MAG TPA: redoxin domain-containing protein, partial [Candidatus Angelobacter sp.]|nr:redoxin domain-containing protein [Candidatus Angelobacter sp.]